VTSQRTFVIVGASTGLGRAAARELAREHRVILCGRNVDQLRAAVPGAAETLRVDLTELADVARLGDELATRGTFAGLICNAGVQTLGAPRFTRDGFEETFAINHLAHYALVTRLLPQLGRVIFIGSASLDPRDRAGRAFGFRGGQYTSAKALAAGEGDPAVDDQQRAMDRYATSKLCNVLVTHALARRGVDAFAIDPGLMAGTGLARERNAFVRLLWKTLLPLLAPLLPGASTTGRSGRALAWLATAEHDGEHRYYDYRRKPLDTWSGALREDWADDLERTSRELIAAKIAS
jgi:NAD(P)-dependent dehydrogenase (short-subunit alcohol dehydrogenase family)